MNRIVAAFLTRSPLGEDWDTWDVPKRFAVKRMHQRGKLLRKETRPKAQRSLLRFFRALASTPLVSSGMAAGE
jgi:hypothetical protein